MKTSCKQNLLTRRPKWKICTIQNNLISKFQLSIHLQWVIIACTKIKNMFAEVTITNYNQPHLINQSNSLLFLLVYLHSSSVSSQKQNQRKHKVSGNMKNK